MMSISFVDRSDPAPFRRPAWRAVIAATVALVGAAAGTVAVIVPSAGAATTPARPATAAGPCQPGATYGSPLPAKSNTATKIREGFSFLEGPVWVASGGYLLMSDMRTGTGAENVQPSTIRRYNPAGSFDEFITAAGSNGLAISADGTEILAATHDQRSVSAYRLSDRGRRTVAANFQGKKFNSPNDLTVAADGTLYFTDPNFQRGNRTDEMGGKTGVFRVRGGDVTLVDNTVSQPNGIALSPDGATLYVASYSNNRIYKYPVNGDGSTGTRANFATISGPDGVAIDCAGNLYWASNSEGRVHVFAPSGAELGTITAGAHTTNAAFGDADGRTLYLTSGSGTGNYGLYRVRLNVPGYPY